MMSVTPRHHHLRFLIAVCIALLPSAVMATAHATTCPDVEVRRTTTAVDAARQTLLQLSIGDGMDTNVSIEANSAIAQMKTSLNNLVSAYLRACVPASAAPDPEKIEKDLSALAHAFRMPTGANRNEDLPKDFGKYGFELWFEVRATKDTRRLVSVTATFAIECGTDTILLVFSPFGGSWKEVLCWESPPYDTVAGAFGSFQYGISPADASGQWYAVATKIDPWCTSSWSNIRFVTMRPAPGSPTILLSRSDPIWWGNEDFGKLVVDGTEFDLRFHSFDIDAELHDRLYIRHFHVTDHQVTRVQPVAASPRDFVDEWLVSPWTEASQWSSPMRLDELRRMHEQLQPLAIGSSSIWFSFLAARRCSALSDNYEFELSYGEERVFYFRVAGRSPFAMVGASQKSDPSCRGPNILDTIKTR